MMKPFWMVYSPSNNPPSRQHESYVDAQSEARRLAEKHPGKEFVVLESVELWITAPPVAHKVTMDGPDGESQHE